MKDAAIASYAYDYTPCIVQDNIDMMQIIFTSLFKWLPDY